jgi:hypothetical protein
MIEDALPPNVPTRLQKDLIATRREVPVANGRSHSVPDNYYTPRLVRWALDQWLANLPGTADFTVLQHTLRTVCADTQSFHSYLQVPEAFAETYAEEIGRRNEHRAELDSVKRVLDAKADRFVSGWVFFLGGALFAAIALVGVAMAR